MRTSRRRGGVCRPRRDVARPPGPGRRRQVRPDDRGVTHHGVRAALEPAATTTPATHGPPGAEIVAKVVRRSGSDRLAPCAPADGGGSETCPERPVGTPAPGRSAATERRVRASAARADGPACPGSALRGDRPAFGRVERGTVPDRVSSAGRGPAQGAPRRRRRRSRAGRCGARGRRASRPCRHSRAPPPSPRRRGRRESPR